MKANFNLAMVRNIALKVRQYKTLFVTAEGVMFIKEEDCAEALRTQNVIIGDPADFVGYVKLTDEDFNTEKLKVYAADVSKFNALFDEATYPRQKVNQKHEGRKHETPQLDSKQEQAEIDALLGLAKEAEPEAPKPEAPKPEAPKPEAPKPEAPKPAAVEWPKK